MASGEKGVRVNLPHNDTASNTDATLDALATEVRSLYRRSLSDWLTCGHKLLEAKRIAPHGSWLPWLKQAGIPERTARRMIRIAEAGLQIGHLADLGGAVAAEDYLAALERAGRNWQASKCSGEVGEVVEAWAPTFGEPLLIAFWQVPLADWSEWAEGDKDTLPSPVQRAVDLVNDTPFWQRLREGVDR